jgi:uncharacterized membrane protein
MAMSASVAWTDDGATIFSTSPMAKSVWLALMSAVFLAERLRIPALVAICLAAFGMVQLNDRGSDVSAE